MATKILWTLWALLPVAGLAYHFGPGQRSYTEDRARDVLQQAQKLDVQAEAAQGVAYEKHLATLTARRAALASKSPEDAKASKDAAAASDEAYRVASDAWKATADKLQTAQDMLASCDSSKTPSVRIAKNRALIRAGKISEGVGDLEAMLESLDESGNDDPSLTRPAREELATGYYYGARLMRMAGKPTNEWREVSGWARQNFRYLAETSDDSAQCDKADELQKNVELVLNLEQSGQEDLLAKPLPKNCPGGNCDGLKTGKKGKTKRPPRNKNDARGAGGVGDIGAGW
jgi:hypothetical protein